MTARVDALTDELSRERDKAQAEAATMIDEARRYRVKVQAQIRVAREQLLAVMSSAGMSAPLPHKDGDNQGEDQGGDAETGPDVSAPEDPSRPSKRRRPATGMPRARPAPPEAAARSAGPAKEDPWESGVRR